MENEKSDVKEKLYPCTFCKSKFKRNEIGKHTKSCQEAFEKRRFVEAEKKAAREVSNSLAAKKLSWQKKSL
jgi:hypothetical protein